MVSKKRIGYLKACGVFFGWLAAGYFFYQLFNFFVHYNEPAWWPKPKDNLIDLYFFIACICIGVYKFIGYVRKVSKISSDEEKYVDDGRPLY